MFRWIRIPRAFKHPETAEAQRLLDAAETLSRNMFVTMNASLALDRTIFEKDLRSRLKEADTDLLRVIIAFARAGLDAALKYSMAGASGTQNGWKIQCANRFGSFQ